MVKDLDFSPRLANNYHEININFKVFPNPAKTEFTISNLLLTELYTFKLYNVNGEMIYSKRFSKTPVEKINTQAICEGFYFFDISSGDSIFR